MIIIVCLDDLQGMMFNQRRQARDQGVISDIAMTCKDSILRMKEYSYKLFQELSLDNVIASSDFLQKGKVGEFCFVEDMSVFPFVTDIEQLIIYRWNRVYPADLYFDINVKEGWELLDTKEFAGSSHDLIKKEIYVNAQIAATA